MLTVLALLSLVFSFAAPVPVHAQTPTAAEQKFQKINEIRTSARATLQERKTAFQETVSAFKNREKAQIVERLVNRLGAVNTKWSANWSNSLKRLSSILEKMDARAETLSGGGADTAAYKSASAEAKSKIKAAQDVLSQQKDAIYVPEIESEEAMGAVVKDIVSQFKNELTDLHSVVKDAYESVRVAFTAFKAISK